MGWDHAATKPNDKPESFVSAYHPSKVRTQSTAGRVLLFAAAFAGPLAFGAVEPWAWALLDLSLIAVFVLWMLAAFRARVLTIVWSPFYIVAVLFIQLGLW